MTHEPKCRQQLDNVGRWMGLMTDDPKLTPDSLRSYGRHVRNQVYRHGNRSGRDILFAHAAQWQKDIADRDAWKRRYLQAMEDKGDE